MSQLTPFTSPFGAKDGVPAGAPTSIHGLRPQPAGPSVHTALGLECHERVSASALVAVLDGDRPDALADRLETALGELWASPVAALPASAIDLRVVLDGDVGPGDLICLTPAMAARHGEAVRAWRAAGLTVEVAAVAPDRLADRLAGTSGTRVWLVAQGLEGRSDAVAPFEALHDLMARFEALHVVIDDAAHMGWTGRGGRGRALSVWSGHPRLVVLADLSVAFGAELAVVASARPGVVERVRDAAPYPDVSRLGAALALAELHAPEILAPLHARLAKRLQLCDRALKNHGLPAIAAGHGVSAAPAEGRPQRFVAAGSAQVAYEVAARLLEQGHFVSAAMRPDGAALRFSVSLAEPHEALLALVEALARELKAASPDGLAALLSSLGHDRPVPQGAPVDIGAWRKGRVRSRR